MSRFCAEAKSLGACGAGDLIYLVDEDRSSLAFVVQDKVSTTRMTYITLNARNCGEVRHGRDDTIVLKFGKSYRLSPVIDSATAIVFGGGFIAGTLVCSAPIEQASAITYLKCEEINLDDGTNHSYYYDVENGRFCSRPNGRLIEIHKWELSFADQPEALFRFG